MTFNLFVQQTRPRDAFPVLISLLVLHAAPYNLAQKCTSLRPINPIKSAPVCCELMELLGYLCFPAQNSLCNFEDPFSAGRLGSSPLNTLYVCNLQHRGCFPLAA